MIHATQEASVSPSTTGRYGGSQRARRRRPRRNLRIHQKAAPKAESLGLESLDHATLGQNLTAKGKYLQQHA